MEHASNIIFVPVPTRPRTMAGMFTQVLVIATVVKLHTHRASQLRIAFDSVKHATTVVSATAVIYGPSKDRKTAVQKGIEPATIIMPQKTPRTSNKGRFTTIHINVEAHAIR